MLALLAAITLSPQQQYIEAEYFAGPGEKEPRFQVQPGVNRLDPPKKSPKQKWLFEYSTGAYGSQTASPSLNLKFRVFAQMRKETDDPAPKVGRMLLRLWDYTYRTLGFDHNSAYNGGIVDIYMCYGGDAGSEQLFDEEIEGGHVKRVNTIYIYRTPTFTDPVEMAREVAHEYGHAILPPVGGFKTPEDWGNGYMGERLFMRNLRDEIAAKRLSSADAMGASLPELNTFVAKNIDPLWSAVARNGPNFVALTKTGQPAMDAYLGAALFASTILPGPAFARSLKLIGSWKAADYPDSIVAAVAERPTMEFRIPTAFLKKPMWIPAPKGSRIVSGATVRSRSGEWAVIVPTAALVKIQNPALGRD